MRKVQKASQIKCSFGVNEKGPNSGRKTHRFVILTNVTKRGLQS